MQHLVGGSDITSFLELCTSTRTVSAYMRGREWVADNDTRSFECLQTYASRSKGLLSLVRGLHLRGGIRYLGFLDIVILRSDSWLHENGDEGYREGSEGFDNPVIGICTS